jgi:hypothetical protein
MKKSPEMLLEPIPAREITDADLFNVEQPDLDPEQKKIEKTVQSGRLAGLKKIVGDYLVPGILEGGTKFKDIVEGTVDVTGEAIRKAAKMGSKVLTGFIPEGHVAMVADKAVGLGVDLGVGVGKGLAKASFHIFTVGGFYWLDAMRQHLAVAEATSEFSGVKNKKEVTAVSYIEHLKDPEMQTNLKNYYKLRKDLSKLRENSEKNKENISEIAGKIAEFEMLYKDSVDLSVFKSILEKGQEFISQNKNLISELAETTAEKIIAETEGYYQNKLGRLAGKVKGQWLEAVGDQPGDREKLKEKIKERLYQVMAEEMADKKVSAEIAKINSDLKKTFGIYSRYLKAALYSVMGLAWHNIDLFKSAQTASEPGWVEDVREVSIHNSLSNFAAAHNMYTNDLSVGSPELDRTMDFDIQPDAVVEDSGLIDAEAIKTAATEKIHDWSEQISERVGEIETVKEINRARKLYNASKIAMSTVANSPALLGVRLGYNVIKYFAF